jgi:hypothetical protein
MSTSRPNTLTFFKDDGGEWRWRMTAPNGEIVADSGEGYSRRIDCQREAQRLFDGNTDYVLDIGNEPDGAA